MEEADVGFGDLDAVARLKAVNIPPLAKLAREGYAILTAIPSCTLMFKQELPLMFPDEADVQLVKEAMWDPFEYLVARSKDGLLKTDFKRDLGKVSYHIPCHGRVQNIGRKTEEMFKLIGQTVDVTASFGIAPVESGAHPLSHALASAAAAQLDAWVDFNADGTLNDLDINRDLVFINSNSRQAMELVPG